MPVRRNRVLAELRVGAIGALTDELVVKPVARSSARKSKPGPASQCHGGPANPALHTDARLRRFNPRRPSSQAFGFLSDSFFTRRAPVSATVGRLINIEHHITKCKTKRSCNSLL